jgi:hypothetical protein
MRVLLRGEKSPGCSRVVDHVPRSPSRNSFTLNMIFARRKSGRRFHCRLVETSRVECLAVAWFVDATIRRSLLERTALKSTGARNICGSQDPRICTEQMAMARTKRDQCIVPSTNESLPDDVAQPHAMSVHRDGHAAVSPYGRAANQRRRRSAAPGRAKIVVGFVY